MYNTDNPASPPTEVYFQEWIPDAEELPDNHITINPLIWEVGEYTHFKIQYTNKIILPGTTTGRMYLFRLTFKSDTCAWKDGLGQTDNTTIVDFPCYFDGSVTGPPGFAAVNR